MRRLAALVPNLAGVAPGQRARIESWTPLLREFGWQVDLYPFEDARLHEVIAQPGRVAAKARGLASCYLAQARRVAAMPPYDVVLVYREAALVGPALLERLVARRPAPMVFDLDDPTFVAYRSPTSGWFSLLKFPRKTNALFRMADAVIAGNRLIGEYASGFNTAVTVIPNAVDIDRYRPAETPGDGFRVVWTGSQSTAPHLAAIAPALARLQEDRPGLEVRVVCDVPVVLPGVGIDMRTFSPETQVADLQDCHVGLVPVADTPWNRWKSFFKTVQYMAVGLPVVGRRIGTNPDIIDDGVNGYLVDSQEDWYDRLQLLATDPERRAAMGAAARQTAVDNFSVGVQTARLAALLDHVAPAGRR
jgi:glycosyltransferase involved in cell wall biosynthesis